MLPQVGPGPAVPAGAHLRRRAGSHDAPALFAGAGPDVDDPVTGRHHAQFMLDHNDGVAGIHQALQLRHQLVHVGRVQAGGGLVKHIQGVTALRALQLGRQLDALGLAA